jgi:predicted amidohydrolase
MERMAKYGVAAVQLNVPDAFCKEDADRNLDRALGMIRNAVVPGTYYGAPVKLVALPECVIHGAPYLTAKEYLDNGVYVNIPGPETDKYVALAKELDVIIATGSMFEHDPKYPGHIFNTCCLVDGDGILLKYRKVSTFVAVEGSSSPLQIKGYDEPLFPVADTPLGKIGVLICYDLVLPENVRQIVYNGAEVLIRSSAYMSPWVCNPPMDLWRVTCQMRSMESVAYAIHVNVGSGIKEMPPFDLPGGSCVVDYEGRILSETRLGGDRIVYGHFDLDSQRAWRATTSVHLGIGHVRAEAYTYLDKPIYPCGTHAPDQWVTPEDTMRFRDEAKKLLGYDRYSKTTGAPV